MWCVKDTIVKQRRTMPWQKGQSGNPNGRPPKSRALTEILEQHGNRTLEDADGKRRGGKRIVARALWEIATTGRTTLPGDPPLELKVEGDGWFDVVKWLYQHIDGPPKSAVDVTTAGESLNDRPVTETQRDRAISTLADALTARVHRESEDG